MTAQSRADVITRPGERRCLQWRPTDAILTATAAAIQSVLSKQPKGLVGIADSNVGGTDWINFGKTLMVGRDGTDISIWSAENFRLLRTIPDHGFSQFAVATSADERLIASVADKPDRIVVYATGDGAKQYEVPMRSPPRDIKFDPTDANRLAVGFHDGQFEIVRLPTGQIDVPLRHANSFGTMSFSRDGKLIATASFDGSFQVADARSGVPVTAVLRVLPPAPRLDANALVGVAGAAISPDGSLVVAVTFSNVAKVFRISDGTIVSETKGICAPLPGVLFADDRHFVLPVCAGVEIHDATTGERTKSLLTPAGGSPPFRMALNPTGDLLAVVAGAPYFNVWSLDGQGVGSSRSRPCPTASQWKPTSCTTAFRSTPT